MAARAPDTGTVDREHAVPLYHQIFVQLRQEITSGVRPNGTRLPTEQELSAQYGVSRITARRALDELAEGQLVKRKRRVGTVVTFDYAEKPVEGVIDQPVVSLLAFGDGTRVEMVDAGIVTARNSVAEALGVEPGTDLWRVSRIRHLENQPLGHFVGYMSPRYARGVSREMLQDTQMLTILTQAGVKIGGARQTISATLADATLSTALKVDIGAPILCVERTVLDARQQPVQHIVAHFRSDLFRVRLDLSAPQKSEAAEELTGFGLYTG